MKLSHLTGTISLLFLAVTFPVAASEPNEISWQDLVPEERSIEDPFAALEYRQVSDLATLYRIEILKSLEDNEKNRVRAREIRESLVSQGLNPEELFRKRQELMQQREDAAGELNTDLLDTSVRLPGYLLPLELIGTKAVEFLLVPFVGACIHTPPPPPNQMVFVRFNEGFEVDELYKPVWITGELRGQQHESELFLADGQAEIETGYFMDAISVEIYK